MTRERDRQSAASIRARLLEHAKRENEEFQRMLVRYANERFLYRLSRSTHRAAFVLKGASLFALWQTGMPRPTKDVDLLGSGAPNPARLQQILVEVLSLDVEPDGLTVVAEKFHAMVLLGLTNSRMKDYFDIAFLAARFPFEGAELARALQATFARRETAVPLELPVGLTDRFAQDSQKRAQWSAFVRRVRGETQSTLEQAVAQAG